MQPYIEHRLGLVGWSGRPAIAPVVFARLHAATGGVPRRINQAANRLFSSAAAEHCEVIDVDLCDRVLLELAGDTIPSSAPAAAASTVAADARIADLERAIGDLAARLERQAAPSNDDRLAAELAALGQRLQAAEQRLAEQEETVRHTLAMLIEWLEAEQATAA